MNEELQQLKRELEELKAWKRNFELGHSIPLNIDQALVGRGFRKFTGGLTVSDGGTGATTLTGILRGNGTSAITAVTPLSGVQSYYVADSSGGVVTRKLTFTDGVLTSQT